MRTQCWTEVYSGNDALINADLDEAKRQVKDVFIESGVLAEHMVANPSCLENLIDKIQSGYKLTPYHDFIHATHVFLNTYVLLNHSTANWPRVEKAAILFTALIHDYEHEGVPNAQLVKEGHHLASKYNNISVAENNSLEKGLTILGEDGTNIFPDFSVSEKFIFDDFCKDIILATDIADSTRVKRIYSSIEEALKNNSNPTLPEEFVLDTQEGIPSIDFSVQNNRKLALCMFMKLSDVGAPLQSIATGGAWVERFFNEQKVAIQNGRGIEVSKEDFVSGQNKFYQFYIDHLVELTDSMNILNTVCINEIKGDFAGVRQFWDTEGLQLYEAWNSKWE